MSLTSAQREALGQTYYASWCLSLASVGWNQPRWEALAEEAREAVRCGIDAVVQTWSAEMAPTEPPTKPDRKLTPSPFAAVRPALEAGRDAAGLSRQRGEDEP